VDVLNTDCATLPDNFGGEIDFVVGWANTRTELNYHDRRIGAEAFNHLSDRVFDDAELGAFAARMDKANRRGFWIYDVNGATISDINAERDAALVGDDTIASGKFATWLGPRSAASAVSAECRPYLIDNCYFVSMNLFRGEERPIVKAGGIANFLMCSTEPLEYFCFIVRYVDSRNSLRENVATDCDRAQRRELFERQLHLPTSEINPETQNRE